MTDDDPNAWLPAAFAASLRVLACPWDCLLGTVQVTREELDAGSSSSSSRGDTTTVESQS